MRAAKVQASLRIRAVLPEPPLLPHTSSESRGTFRQKAISLAPLNGWACAVKICDDGMLEDTISLDGAHFVYTDESGNCWTAEFQISTGVRFVFVTGQNLCQNLREIFLCSVSAHGKLTKKEIF